MKLSEKDLLLNFQADRNVEESFRQIVATYKERLYWHIRNMVKNHDDADDVLQNTFIKIFRNIKNFKGESKLYTWMYRIASNEAITFLNSKAKRNNINSSELQDHLVAQLETDVYFEGDQIQLKLQKAIATLPQKQQQVFNMKYFEELKYSEMSEILGTSEGALKASFHIATKKIEQFLKED